jgi:hypothetical protein
VLRPSGYSPRNPGLREAGHSARARLQGLGDKFRRNRIRCTVSKTGTIAHAILVLHHATSTNIRLNELH